MDAISVFGSLFGLARSAFSAILGLFGLVAPKLDLTFEPGKAPYVESDETMTWVVEPVPDSSNSTASQQSSPRRWYRVGIKNRSMATVDDVRVELVSIDPPAIGHLPMQLAIMHGATQPLVVHRANEPTYFADVVLKLDVLDRMHIMTPAPSPRAQGGIPAGRYRLGIRVTGRNTPATTKHYIADVDGDHRLLFVAD
jgi:hypothetical protein